VSAYLWRIREHEYYNSLESYVDQRGFDLKAFYDGFQTAAALG
jgi:hypothetical protein